MAFSHLVATKHVCRASKLNLQKFQSFIRQGTLISPLPQQNLHYLFCGGAKFPLQPGGGSFCPWLFEEDILFESIQLLGVSQTFRAVWYAQIEAVEGFVDLMKVLISMSHHCDDNKEQDWLFAFLCILWIYNPLSNSGK